MISAFKNIRLSGYNLIPKLDTTTNVLRLSLGGTGLANYNELTSLSGYLQGLINTADDDVTRINNLSGAVTIQGSQGVGVGIDPATNTITISGADSGYFQGLINTLTTNLESTGTTLTTNLASTGTTLNTKIENTGTALRNQVVSLSGDLGLTGAHVYANFVRKATQQSFTLNVPTNVETTGILFPVAFSSTPASVNITLEVPGDVMYMTSIKNKSSSGFTADFSDVILEEGVKINTFASNPTNT
jgi:hypothetical protein